MTDNKLLSRYAAVSLTDQDAHPPGYWFALESTNGATSGKCSTVAQDEDDKVAEVPDNVVNTIDGTEDDDDVGDAADWRLMRSRRTEAAARKSSHLDEQDRRSLLVWGGKDTLTCEAVEVMCRNVVPPLSSALLYNMVVQQGGHVNEHDRHVRITLNSIAARDNLRTLLCPVAKAAGWRCTKGWTLRERREARDRLEERRERAKVPPAPVARLEHDNPFEPLIVIDDEKKEERKREEAKKVPKKPKPKEKVEKPLVAPAAAVPDAKEAKDIAAIMAPAAVVPPPSQDTIRIGCWNAHGVRDKEPELQVYLEKFPLDILTISETYLYDGDKWCVSPYAWYPAKRARPARGQHSLASGGVGILVSPRLQGRVVECSPPAAASDTEHQLWLELPGSGLQRPMYFCSVYLPPKGHAEEKFQEALNHLQEAVTHYCQQGDVVVMGDYNVHIGSPRDEDEKLHLGAMGAGDRSTRGTALVNLMMSQDLVCLNNRGPEVQYTWESGRNKSIIDYILVSRPLYREGKNNCQVVDGWLKSDHRLVRAEVGTVIQYRARERHRARTWPVYKLRQDENVAEAYQAAASIALEGWNPEVKLDADEKLIDATPEWTQWLNKVKEAANRVLQQRKARNNGAMRDWYPEVKALVLQRRAAYVAMSRDPDDESKTREYYRLRKLVKHTVREKKRASFAHFMEEMCAWYHNGDTRFWKQLPRLQLLSGVSTPASASVPMRDHLGNLVVDPETLLKVWARHYKSLYSAQESKRFDAAHLDSVTKAVQSEAKDSLNEAPGPLDADFTEAELQAVLDKMPNGKAGGVDELRPELLKQGGDRLRQTLLQLVNHYWKEENIPQQWQQGVIVSLFKSGDKADVGNYRPITLLSVVGKLFASLMATRLSAYMESRGLLADEQNGFRPNRGCVHHIFTLQSIIRMRKANKDKTKQGTYAFFLDLSKAFDSVWRDGLWHKLWEMGVRGKMWRMLRCLYSRVSSCVNVNGERSEWFDVSVGVRQGCPLSPLLFAVFINGLVDALKPAGIHIGDDEDDEKNSVSFNSLLFADDVVVLANSPEELQDLINKVERYLNLWRLTANLKKSKVMEFGTDTRSGFAYTMYGNGVEVVPQYKYLGVIFHQNCMWNEHQRTVLGKCREAIAKYARVWNNKHMSTSMKLTLYKVYVRPVSEYASAVIDFDARRVDPIQNEVLRRILRCNAKTNTWAVLGELGLEPLTNRRDCARLTWFATALQSPSPITRAVTRQQLSKPGKLVTNRIKTYRLTDEWEELQQAPPYLPAPAGVPVVPAMVPDVPVIPHDPDVLVIPPDPIVPIVPVAPPAAAADPVPPPAVAAEGKHKVKDAMTTWTEAVKTASTRQLGAEFKAACDKGKKMRILATFKTEPALAPYLAGVLTFLARTKFKLRSCTNSLATDSHRRAVSRKQEDSSSKCGLCKVQDETEEHFLLECKALSSIRDAKLAQVRATPWGNANWALYEALSETEQAAFILGGEVLGADVPLEVSTILDSAIAEMWTRRIQLLHPGEVMDPSSKRKKKAPRPKKAPISSSDKKEEKDDKNNKKKSKKNKSAKTSSKKRPSSSHSKVSSSSSSSSCSASDSSASASASNISDDKVDVPDLKHVDDNDDDNNDDMHDMLVPDFPTPRWFPRRRRSARIASRDSRLGGVYGRKAMT